MRPRRVEAARDRLVGPPQRRLAGLEVRCADRVGQEAIEAVGVVEAGERRPEPLGVRRVAACDQQREPHDVAGEAGGEHARAQLVADLRRALDEGLLLREPAPLAAQQPAPHRVRVPGELLAARARAPRCRRGRPRPRTRRAGAAGASRASRRSRAAGWRPRRAARPATRAASPPSRGAGRGRAPSRSARASRGTCPAAPRRPAATASTSAASTNTCTRGPQPWSVERAVSKPEHVRPGPDQRRRVRHVADQRATASR